MCESILHSKTCSFPLQYHDMTQATLVQLHNSEKVTKTAYLMKNSHMIEHNDTEEIRNRTFMHYQDGLGKYLCQDTECNHPISNDPYRYYSYVPISNIQKVNTKATGKYELYQCLYSLSNKTNAAVSYIGALRSQDFVTSFLLNS